MRQRIETAALELFSRHGYDAVSVERIVAEAGVSKGAFFIFHESKADALAVVGRRLSERLAAEAEAIDPARPLAALAAFASVSEAMLAEDAHLHSAYLRCLAGKGAESVAVTAATRLCERLQAAGSIDADLDPACAGEMIAAAWYASALTRAGAGFAGALTPKLRLLFAGLRP
ncbi:MAG: TetR family transcriptional regulator [Caulobacteraceae bacterium]